MTERTERKLKVKDAALKGRRYMEAEEGSQERWARKRAQCIVPLQSHRQERPRRSLGRRRRAATRTGKEDCV